MKKLFSLALLIACAAPLAARDTARDAIIVNNAWVRATVPGQKVTGLFLRIESAGPATLVGVSVPVDVAGETEIHETLRHGDMAHMQRVDRVELAAGKPLELKPGGHHVMLIDLRQPLSPGAAVPVTLKFLQGGKPREVPVRAIVRPVADTGNHPAMHGSAH